MWSPYKLWMPSQSHDGKSYKIYIVARLISKQLVGTYSAIITNDS